MAHLGRKHFGAVLTVVQADGVRGAVDPVTPVATQVPVAEWHVRFPDPTIGDAILDRLIHNAYRLNLKGESRRKINSPLTMPTT